MGIRGPHCEVRSHSAFINFAQNTATTASPDPVTYFEDHTVNHYKALIDVRILTITRPLGADVDVAVVIERRGGQQPPIEVPIPLFPQPVGTDGILGQVVVQVEDAARVSIRYEVTGGDVIGSPVATGTISIQKDFCICCP